MRVLVTGGAGYIGSGVVRTLLQNNHQVFVYDNFSSGYRENIPADCRWILGDVRDRILLSRYLKDQKIEAVVHLAAKLVVPESLTNPFEYYDNNTLGVLSLVEGCRQNQIHKIIFSSTAAIYGLHDSVPIAETDLVAPIHPYGWSKFMSEQILKDADSAYGIRSIVLRYFNVAGADLEQKVGCRKTKASHLFKVAAEAACNKRPSVSIFGTDYETRDGSAIRDFIHISDLADLHVLALKRLESTQSSDVFNCGYGVGYTVKEVLQTMQKVSGNDFNLIAEPRRQGDAVSIVADNSKIKNDLQWQPRFNDINKICQTSYEWEKNLL